MENKKHLSTLMNSDFFNELPKELIEYLLIIPHENIIININENENIHLREFTIKPTSVYGSDRKFYLIQNNSNIDNLYDIENLFQNNNVTKRIFFDCLMTESKNKNLQMVYNSDNHFISDIIYNISLINKEKALELQREYSKYCFQYGKEVIVYENNLLNQPVKLKEFLKKNHMIKEIYDITIDDNSDQNAINEWFINIENIKENKTEIMGFNDLDLYPFLFKDYLIIEDISADSMLICKYENDKNFTWYVTAKDYFNDKDSDLINETVYESNQYIEKIISKNLNEFKKALEVKNGEIISCTTEMEYVHLLQNYIVSELIKNGKIESADFKVSFKDLLLNYTTQKEIWNIEERAFFDMLSELEYNGENLTYKNFILIDSKNYIIKHEDKKYFQNENIEKKLEDVDIKINISPQDKLEILDYVDELINRYPEAEKSLSKIKEIIHYEPNKAISTFKKKIKI